MFNNGMSWILCIADACTNKRKKPTIKWTKLLLMIHIGNRFSVWFMAFQVQATANCYFGCVHTLMKYGKGKDGVQFQYVAPLNSMANNIGGSTMHTWAGLKFTNSEGVQISGDMLRKGKDNVSQRHLKCAKLRFLFIDEMECGGTVHCHYTLHSKIK